MDGTTAILIDDNLIRRLAQADGGSRELDCAIWRALGRPLGRTLRSSHGEYLCTEGDEAVPPFTSSLDAAVPGEDIEMVSVQRRVDGVDRWCALQRFDKRGRGRHEAASARTEILARRIAGLMALART